MSAFKELPAVENNLGKIVDQLAKEHDSLFKISDELRTLFAKYDEPPLELVAEYFACSVIPRNSPSSTKEAWPGHFQPFMVMGGRENPGRKFATREAWDYWVMRSETTNSALLQVRYTDLAIDFATELSGKGAHNTARNHYVDAAIRLASLSGERNAYEILEILDRALVHSFALKKNAVWDRLRDAILHTDQIAAENEHHLPTHSLEMIRHKYIQLEEATAADVVKVFEAALVQINARKPDFWKAERALDALLSHFSKIEERARRIAYVQQYEQFTRMHQDLDSGMRTEAQWTKVLEAYGKVDYTEGVNRALAELRLLGPLVNADMKPVRIEFSIDRQDIDDVINWLATGDMITDCIRFSRYYMFPNREFDMYLKSRAEETLITDFATTIKVDGRGRTITRTIRERLTDTEKMICDINDYIQLSPVILHHHIEKLKEQKWFNASAMCQLIFLGGHIPTDHILIEAIQLYFQDWHIAFLSTAIPRLERMLRDECERLGGKVLRQNRTGGLDYTVLHELLQEPVMEKTFDPQQLLYLRTIFVEKHGVNLRNNLLHGITSGENKSEAFAQRGHQVFQIIVATAAAISSARMVAKQQSTAS